MSSVINNFSQCTFENEKTHFGDGNIIHHSDKSSDVIDGNSTQYKDIATKETPKEANALQQEISWYVLDEDISSLSWFEQIKHLLHHWRNLYDIQKNNDGAAAIVVEIASAVEKCSEESETDLSKVYSLYGLFIDISDCCRKNKKMNEAVHLSLSQLIILQKCNSKSSPLLNYLVQLGISFVDYAHYFYQNGNKKEFLRTCVYIENVLDEMYSVNIDNCFEKEKSSYPSVFAQKTDKICSILLEYGKLCLRVKYFAKAIVVFPQIVSLLKLVHGISSKELVECYYHIGSSYANFSIQDQASEMFRNAFKTFNAITNWSNVKEKQDYHNILSEVYKN